MGSDIALRVVLPSEDESGSANIQWMSISFCIKGKEKEDSELEGFFKDKLSLKYYPKFYGGLKKKGWSSYFVLRYYDTYENYKNGKSRRESGFVDTSHHLSLYLGILGAIWYHFHPKDYKLQQILFSCLITGNIEEINEEIKIKHVEKISKKFSYANLVQVFKEFAESNLFYLNDFYDFKKFVIQLRNPSIAFSQYLLQLFSPELQKSIMQNKNSEEIQEKLIQEINELIQTIPLYKAPCFPDKVQLPKDIQKKIDANEDFLYINRLILENLYPNEIKKSHFDSKNTINLVYPSDGEEIEKNQRKDISRIGQCGGKVIKFIKVDSLESAFNEIFKDIKEENFFSSFIDELNQKLKKYRWKRRKIADFFNSTFLIIIGGIASRWYNSLPLEIFDMIMITALVILFTLKRAG